MNQLNPPMKNQYGDDTIDVRQLLKRFTRHWYLFAISLFVMVGIGITYLKLKQKSYRVKAKVILANSNAQNLPKEIEGLDLFLDNSEIEDKIGILTSFNLIRATVQELNMGISYYSKDGLKVRKEYRDVPFEIEVDSTHEQLAGVNIFVGKVNDLEFRVRVEGDEVPVYDLSTFEVMRNIQVKIDKKVRIGEPFVHPHLNFKVIFKDHYDTYLADEYFFVIHTLDGMAEAWQDKIAVTQVSNESSILEIASEGPLVEMEKKFVNALLDSYQRKEKQDMTRLAMRTIAFLDSQIWDLANQRASTAGELINVTRRSRTMNAGNTETLTSNQLAQLERDKGKVLAELNYYQNVLHNTSDKGPDDNLQLAAPSSLGIPDGVLNNLIIKLSTLREERVDLELSAGRKGPLWEVNTLKIANTLRDINANVSSSANAKEIELNQLNQQIARLRGRLTSLPAASAQIKSIEDISDIQDERYKDLLDKRTKAMMAMQAMPMDIEVIENAKQDGDGPAAPQKSFVMLIALFLGTLIPAGFILVKDFFDNRIGGHADIESATNIPVLGFVARHDRNSNYIVPKDSRTALAESFRSIRIKMQYLNEDVRQQLIGLTSSSSGEGKTFCATNLAAVMAQAGKKTLLIDIDLRRPRVTRYFESGDGRGLSTYLMGELNDITEVIHPTHIDNLDVIHSGPVCTNPLDLIATDRMKAAVEKFRDLYDHVVFDTPPVGMVSDYLVIMKLTDFNIYVLRDSTTSVDSLRMINELYDNEKIKNVGLLINDVKSVANYGYIDNYYGYGDGR
jgi:capsular exopolysaccharide synthesis family protein